MAQYDEDWYKNEIKRIKNLRDEQKSYYAELEGVSKKRRQTEEEEFNFEIKRLKDKVARGETLQAQEKELLDLLEKQYKVHQKQYEVVGRIQSQVKGSYDNMVAFLQTSAAQYNYAEKIAKEYLNVSRNLGANAGMADRLTRSFKDALPEVESLGGSMEDISSIMQTFADESGRISILNREDISNIEAIAKGVNISASEAATMAESFDLMGISTQGMSHALSDVFKDSQSIGLNANKVVKMVAKNMGTMQSYSFANGVRGMTEMAKQAVKMRIDVSDVLQMSEKFYQPEAAIEAAANLQMLGGDIAKAFGDPFETMYLARNKPEELAKRLGDMTENMMQFNEETGEYEFPAEVRMQLKSAGEQLGINTDKMIEMARQSSKIKDLKMKFTSIGDEDTKENLAALAKYSEKEGKFVIQHKGEELGLDEISGGLAEEIIKANANEGKTDSDLFKNIAINTQTMSEQLQSYNESIKATVAGTTDIYEITAQQMNENLFAPMKEGMNAAVASFKDSFNAKDLFDTVEWENTFDSAKNAVKEYTDELFKLKSEVQDNGVSNNKTVPTNGVCPSGMKLDSTGKWCEAEDLVSLPGSNSRVMTGEFGSVMFDDRDLIVAGDPNKLTGGNESTNNSSLNVGGTVDININVTSDNPTLDLSSHKEDIVKTINKILTSKLPDGNYGPQSGKGLLV